MNFRRPASARAAAISVEERRGASNSFAIWLLMIGVFTPGAMKIFIGDAKLIPGRIAICILLLPALIELVRKGRHLVAADFLIGAASVWIVGATLQTDAQSWSSAVATVLEFSGAYIVARAYVFGALALHVFVRALKFVSVIVIALAALEHLTQSVFTNNLVAWLWGLPTYEPEYRSGLLRAYSTFAHPIFYGAFCASAAAIFLFYEKNLSSRVLYGVFCFVGCVMAMSSAPLISFMLAVSVYGYDQIMQRSPWRWRALQLGLVTFFAAVYATTNKPISWIVSHLTLDPSTGYFRVATWDTSLYYIDASPLVGYGFEAYGEVGDFFANATVDSVWLVMALRFGVPLVALLLLANIASFFRSGRTAGRRHADPYMDNMRTALTLVLVIFIFVGLTVHFWNNIWMLWGLFIGVRASLHEDYFRPIGTPALDRLIEMAPRRTLRRVSS